MKTETSDVRAGDWTAAAVIAGKNGVRSATDGCPTAAALAFENAAVFAREAAAVATPDAVVPVRDLVGKQHEDGASAGQEQER